MSRPITQAYSKTPNAPFLLKDISGTHPNFNPEFNPALLEYKQAIDCCLSAVDFSLPVEEIALDYSLGRVLARDQVCPVYVPPWNRAMMDGYAVKTSDVREASSQHPVTLRQIDAVPAGCISSKKIRSGETIRIMTGACVPDGADAVIKLEDTRKLDDRVAVFNGVGDNPYILAKGRDLMPGDIAAKAGRLVTPALMGILAAGGICRVTVFTKPVVAIIPTGSELIAPGNGLAPGRIYDINSHTLFGLCLESGATPVNAGIVKDRSGDLLDILNRHMDKDIILLSGGVSVGDYDIVHATLMRAGVTEIFWRIKVQPGKPLFFGRRGRTLVFGLPGNPVSSFVNFHLFVRPVIAKMQGKTCWSNATITARLVNDRLLKPGRRKFLRGKLNRNNHCTEVEIIGEQRSGVFSPLLNADVLIEVPGDVNVLRSGDAVKVHLLNTT